MDRDTTQRRLQGDDVIDEDADRGPTAEPIDPDPAGMPGAAFDRRTMDAEGGESELDDDSQLDAAFSPRSG